MWWRKIAVVGRCKRAGQEVRKAEKGKAEEVSKGDWAKGKTLGCLMARYGNYGGKSGRASQLIFTTGRRKALLVPECARLHLPLFEGTLVVPTLLQK